MNQVANVGLPMSHKSNHQPQAFVHSYDEPPPRAAYHDDLRSKENICSCHAPGCLKNLDRSKLNENFESKNTGDTLPKKREKKGGRRYFDKFKNKTHCASK